MEWNALKREIEHEVLTDLIEHFRKCKGTVRYGDLVMILEHIRAKNSERTDEDA